MFIKLYTVSMVSLLFGTAHSINLILTFLTMIKTIYQCFPSEGPSRLSKSLSFYAVFFLLFLTNRHLFCVHKALVGQNTCTLHTSPTSPGWKINLWCLIFSPCLPSSPITSQVLSPHCYTHLQMGKPIAVQSSTNKPALVRSSFLSPSDLRLRMLFIIPLTQWEILKNKTSIFCRKWPLRRIFHPYSPIC